MINKVKGTYDVLPSEIKKWQYLESKIKEITTKYNYQEMRTPIMEYSGVFHRASELSDMVTKETYNFLDKGNREVTLKPEGTAGIIRSYVENKLYATNDLFKAYYVSQMFRYERPQKGRYRQFMQFGIEAVGSKSPLLDAETISLAAEFVESLGLKNVEVEINSIGDNDSRVQYQEALVNYLMPFKEDLSNDSKNRLINNPLRILDSKDKKDQEIIKDAPRPLDFLSNESKEYFEDVLTYLKNFNITYSINNSLVRGLDYYSETVFEVKANIKNFGSQNVLGGGGRYEQLVSELGGPKTSAIGFAFGMERLLIALEEEGLLPEEKDSLDVFIITFSKDENLYASKIFSKLRNHGLMVDIDFDNRNFKSQLRKALAKNAKTLVIIGKNEVDTMTVSLKNTKTEVQEIVKLDELISKIESELVK